MCVNQIMAASSSAARERAQLLKQLIKAAQTDGSITDIMHELEIEEPDADGGFSVVSHMTDASKRRKESPPPREEVMASRDSQSPVIPKGKNCAADYGTALPTGVPDMNIWGGTLITAGKLGNKNLSYKDLVESVDQEHQNYVQYLLTQRHRTDLTGPVKDLVRYCFCHSEMSPGGPLFDDSGMKRQYKKK